MSDNQLATWLGNREHREELLTGVHVDALNALLDRDNGIPLGLQWLLCQERAPQSRLGDDGHPRRGDFLPPVALPRRMWAAGEVHFHGAAVPGEMVTRASTIADIQHKRGSSGELVFVRVDHDYTAGDRAWLSERHTIVYREANGHAQPASEALNADDFAHRADIVTDEVQLFRYSAMTFNGHRIHYDQRYVTEVEGYPGLVVHGPLMATWLMNFADAGLGDRALARFRFRVHAPLFVGDTVTLLAREEAGGLALAVANAEGRRILSADATLQARRG